MQAKTAATVKRVIQAVVIVALGYLVRQKIAETHAPVWIAASWLLSAWVVLRIAVAIRRSYSRIRVHTREGVNIRSLDNLTAASMPTWSRGYYAIEKRVYKGFWHAVTRKPFTPAGEFSVAGGPIGAGLAPLLLLFVATCAALVFAHLPDLVTAFLPRIFAFSGAGCAFLYAAIWIIGDRRALKEGGHRVTSDELIVDLGIRCAGTVVMEHIAACLPIAGPTRASDTWTVSPGEAPNVLIELAAPVTLQITAFGSPREIRVGCVALYVDEPVEFIDVLTRARGRLRAAA